MDLKKIKCVIVDYDETLYSHGYWEYEHKVFGKYLVKHNILPDIPDYKDKLAYLHGLYPNLHAAQYICAYLDDHKIDKSKFEKVIHQVKFDIRGDDTVYIKPEIIEKLSKLYDIYILSDSGQAYLKYNMKIAKIKRKWFVDVLTNTYSDENYTKIPVMKKILSKTGLKADEIIMIGDSRKADIIPAQSVGFQTFHVESVADTEKILQELIDIKS